MKKANIVVLTALLLAFFFVPSVTRAVTQDSGSVGVQGVVPADPPKVGATISLPNNGQNFTTSPITVTGLCPAGLLVKLFKSNVFGGSTQCQANGTYSIQVDLFVGQNELIARVVDNLNQSAPDSNSVNVTFNDGKNLTVPQRVLINTTTATRGSNPGEAVKWTFTISGGQAPYALTIDWGDGTIEPVSVAVPGEVTISHIFQKPGVFIVIIKGTDVLGTVAFLQVISVTNGEIVALPNAKNEETARVIIRYSLWPVYLLIPVVLTTFWLGRRNENKSLRKKIERGEQPFA